LPDIFIKAQYPNINETQFAALQISSAAFDSAGVQQLTAMEHANGGVLATLPDDQWVQEMVSWERNVWSQLRTRVTDYAVGYEVREPLMAAAVNNETTTGQRQLCGMQRMKSPGGFL
jgi:hypothetical protein